MIRKRACKPARGRTGEFNSSTVMASASSGGTQVIRAVRKSPVTLILIILASTALASLSREEAKRIGHKIWQNESGGTIAGLTAWNTGEDFASLGIGHFIWYPAGRPGPFEERFPRFIDYAKAHGTSLPPFFEGQTHCPWDSRAAFLRDESAPQMKALRKFLAGTIDLQVDFLIGRMQQALPKMLAAVPENERARISRQFQNLASTAQGCYGLIDYVNFKGEGVLETERYRGKGWGLLQVLEGMPEGSTPQSAPREYAASAARVLRERVNNSPPARNERRWLPGWLDRIATYR
jgi:hypothetical protein